MSTLPSVTIQMSQSRQRASLGFTLSEILIALAILGVIAMFTIPKVLQNQVNTQKQGVLKETYAALNQVMEQGLIMGELTPGRANMGDYFLDHVNAVKLCRTNAGTEGCWDTATQGTFNGEHLEPGFVLNGAVVGRNLELELALRGLCNRLEWFQGSKYLGGRSAFADYSV